jgi:hypothetical protein
MLHSHPTRYRSKKTGRYVSKAYAARYPDATKPDDAWRRRRASMLLAAAGAAVAAPMIGAAAYRRFVR